MREDKTSMCAQLKPRLNVVVALMLMLLPIASLHATEAHEPSIPQSLSLSTSGAGDLRIQWAPPRDTGYSHLVTQTLSSCVLTLR